MWPCGYIAICSAFNDCIIPIVVDGQTVYLCIYCVSRICGVCSSRASIVCNQCIAISKSMTVHDIHSNGQTRSSGALRVNAIPIYHLNQSAVCAILCTQSRAWYVCEPQDPSGVISVFTRRGQKWLNKKIAHRLQTNFCLYFYLGTYLYFDFWAQKKSLIFIPKKSQRSQIIMVTYLPPIDYLSLVP